MKELGNKGLEGNCEKWEWAGVRAGMKLPQEHTCAFCKYQFLFYCFHDEKDDTLIKGVLDGNEESIIIFNKTRIKRDEGGFGWRITASTSWGLNEWKAR